tara:strand:- start:320 stop:478 length:159 start_codon:yes stop_codon:yes gene_type:complete
MATEDIKNELYHSFLEYLLTEDVLSADLRMKVIESRWNTLRKKAGLIHAFPC